MKRTLRILSTALALAGLTALACAGWQWETAARFERRALAEVPATAPPHAMSAPAAAAPAAGSVLGEIEIPRLGVRTALLEGDSNAILRLGAGHVPGTALPGGPGNLAIAAHRDTFFRPLKDIRVGDRIRIETASATESFSVVSTAIVEPSDAAVLRSTPETALTLITCYPFYYVGPAPRRFIVRALRAAPLPTLSQP